MTRIRRMKRVRQGAKRPDMTGLRDILKDGRCWAAIGVVHVPDGEPSHYEIVTDASGNADVLVEVDTQPDGKDLTCRLGSGFGGAGFGSWKIPNVGDEVAVLIPEGHPDFMPIIVGVLASGSLPDGVAPNVTVIADSQVLIHDGAGGAAELPTMAEFRAHTHTTGVGPSGPTIDPIPGVGAITGTEALKAK